MPPKDLVEAIRQVHGGKKRIPPELAARLAEHLGDEALTDREREAVVNAFRHAGANGIEIEMEYAARRLRVLVRDDGRGACPQTPRSGSGGRSGLAGMRERAEDIGARIKVRRRAAGTEVELSVPSRVAYLNQHPFRPRKWLASLSPLIAKFRKPGPEEDR
jgi:signal transduction histidine kinase